MDDELRHWLAQVCREIREAPPRFRRSDVASDISRESDAIRNFETVRGQWNPQTGKIVESYAERGGTTALAIWTEALTRWRSSQASTPAVEDRPANASDTHMPQGNPDKLLDSAGRKSQKRAR